MEHKEERLDDSFSGHREACSSLPELSFWLGARVLLTLMS